MGRQNCPIETKINMARQDFAKFFSIIFRENQFSSSRFVRRVQTVGGKRTTISQKFGSFRGLIPK